MTRMGETVPRAVGTKEHRPRPWGPRLGSSPWRLCGKAGPGWPHPLVLDPDFHAQTLHFFRRWHLKLVVTSDF